LVTDLLDQLDLGQTSVILTSDHGNIEDLTSRNHTLNAVPTIVWGAKRDAIAARISNLADITPVVIETLTKIV
jgi:2,3-bisphosphoglycerate-independent phosphoglycerate mutase